MKVCECCGKPGVVGRMLCRACYQRNWRNGSIEEFEKDKPPVRDRLLAGIEKRPSGCWEWQGMKRPDGYGMIWFEGKNQRAHRVAFAEFKHPLKPRDILCHKCDNRMCVNPDHIFIGTRSDNVKDAAAKNRLPVNDQHWNTKLTVVQVAMIRAAEGIVTHAALAKQFGVAQSTITRIISGDRRAKSNL